MAGRALLTSVSSENSRAWPEVSAAARLTRAGRRHGADGERPLLTIAIPTYQRAPFLAELLKQLVGQLIFAQSTGGPPIELLISDNASADETAEVVRQSEQSGLPLRYVRNSENIGPDANFLQCFNLARGKYFLLLGDDDLLLPGAMPKILSLLESQDPDILYLASYPFTTDFKKEQQKDPLARSFQVLKEPLQFVRAVNLMLTFISGIIVNRDRLIELQEEPIAAFMDTNLIQLSWTLPLLKNHRRSICVWERLLAGRVNNSGGYNIARVFGVNLKRVAERLLPNSPRITQALSNAALRRWFPGAILDLRLRQGSASEVAEIKSLLFEEHGGNFRLYGFVYPVLMGPVWLAKIWVSLTRVVNKLIYVAYFPTFWRQP